MRANNPGDTEKTEFELGGESAWLAISGNFVQSKSLSQDRVAWSYNPIFLKKIYVSDSGLDCREKTCSYRKTWGHFSIWIKIDDICSGLSKVQDIIPWKKFDNPLKEWFVRNSKLSIETWWSKASQSLWSSRTFHKQSFQLLWFFFGITSLSGCWCQEQNEWVFRKIPVSKWNVFGWGLDGQIEHWFFGGKWVAISRNFNTNCAVWHFLDMKITTGYLPSAKFLKIFVFLELGRVKKRLRISKTNSMFFFRRKIKNQRKKCSKFRKVYIANGLRAALRQNRF